MSDPSPQSEQPAIVAEAAYAEAVRVNIGKWRDRLIDLSRRNPLLTRSPSARSVVDLRGLPIPELYDRLTTPRKKLVLVPQPDKDNGLLALMAADEVKEDTDDEIDPLATTPNLPAGHLALPNQALKVVNALRLKGASAQREQGVNVLFIAFGVLEWPDPEPNRSGVLRSPLFLVPVAVDRVAGTQHFTLRKTEDEIVLNPTLAYRLALPDVAVTLPPLPDEDDLQPLSYLKDVESVVAGRTGWTVHLDAYLGAFHFLKFVMYRDLDAQMQRACWHPIIAAIAGDRIALDRLPSVAVPDADGLDSVLSASVEPLHSVLDADPSQQRAVLAAKRGQSYVLQGPPGTGKTQTIANIIAEMIADGKRVLFVSQKQSALDQVKDRLQKKGLGELCLEAHSHKANKKDVVEQLRAAVKAVDAAAESATKNRRRGGGGDVGAKHTALNADRDALDAYVRELHQVREPLGISVYDANGIVAAEAVAGAPDLPFVFVRPEAVNASDNKTAENLVTALAGFADIFHEVETHPWRGIRAERLTLDLQTTVRSTLNDLLEITDQLARNVATLARECGVPEPADAGTSANLSDINWFLAIADALTTTAHPPRAWLIDAPLEALSEEARTARAQYRAFLDVRDALFKVYDQALLALAPSTLADLDQRLSERHTPVLSRALGTEIWHAEAARRQEEWDGLLIRAIGAVERLSRVLAATGRLCGLDGSDSLITAALPDTLSASQYALRVADAATKDPRPERGWFAPDVLAGLVVRVKEAEERYYQYRTRRTKLLATYTENILAFETASALTDLSERLCERHATVLSPALGMKAWHSEAARHQEAWDKQLERALSGLENLSRTLVATIRLCGLDAASAPAMAESADTLASSQYVLRVADASIIDARPERGWFVPGALAGLAARAQEIREKHEQYRARRAELLSSYDEGILALDLPSLITRFADDYMGPLRFLKPGFYRDRKQIRLHLKSGVNLADRNMLTDLRLAQTVADTGRWIEENRSPLVSEFGVFHYRGLDTDWQRLTAALAQTEALMREFSGGRVPALLIERLVESGPALETLRDQANVLRRNLTEFRQQTSALEPWLVALGNLPFTNLPLQHAPFGALRAWLNDVRTRLADYQEARATVLALRHREGSLVAERDLLADLSLAQSVIDGARWIEENKASLASAFGAFHYQGLDTDWQRLATALSQTEAVAREFSGGRVPDALVNRLVESGPALEALRDQANVLRRNLTEFREQIAELQTWLVALSGDLPFTDEPLLHARLGALRDWLVEVRARLADHHEARAAILVLRRNLPGGGYATPNSVSSAELARMTSEARWLQDEATAITAEEERMRSHYAHFFAGLDTDWDAILAALDWASATRVLFGKNAPPEGFLSLTCTSAGGEKGGDAGAFVAAALASVAVRRTSLAETHARLMPVLAILDTLFVSEILPDATAASFGAWGEWLEERVTRIADLERWVDFQNLRRQCERVGLLSFYDVVTHRQLPREQIVPAFRKRFYRLWLDATTDASEPLRRFRGEDHERVVRHFRALDEGEIEDAPGRVLEKVAARRKNPLVNVGETRVLRELLARQRRLPPIRRILASIPNILFDYKPCLMMSPLSVSLYLDADMLQFDAVIFDEASQVFVEDALGAILRARQVIIAGDTRQLPPTSFFQNLQGDGGDEEDEADFAVQVTGVSGTGYDSILNAADAITQSYSSGVGDVYEARFAEHWLLWHYRSRHESLIAFSRRWFYDNPPLKTFPAAQPGTAVSFVHVENGIYYGGNKQSRMNPVEAARVVDLVINQRLAKPSLSVGVITFSEAQQRAVLAEIEKRTTADPSLTAVLSADEETETLFVKNIETVQGDERDVIFLSVGYARDANGGMRMNFGPLNRDGGERRLNVAVSRARQKMTVVSSILPSDIDLARTDKTGPTRLREFLQYALTGALDRGNASAVPERGAFEAAVEAALAARGINTIRQVGMFDYRVDLAVLDPKDPNHFLLGIQCDGPMYAGAETVRARERLRPAVLGGMGWRGRLYRMWSCDWVRDPDREMARLLEALDRAVRGEELDTPALATSAYPTNEAEVTDSGDLGGQDDPARELPPGVTYFSPVRFRFRGGQNTLYGATRAEVAEREAALVYIVQHEGPLTLTTAAQRMTEAAGLTRTGPKIKSIVEQTALSLVRRQLIEMRGEFLWSAGMETPPARVPHPGDEPRPIEQIAIDEIVEIMVALLNDAVGVTHDEAVEATARLMGYQQTGSQVRQRIEDAIAVLELDTRADVRSGQVRALEL